MAVCYLDAGSAKASPYLIDLRMTSCISTDLSQLKQYWTVATLKLNFLGVLPAKRDVVQYLMFLLKKDRAGKNQRSLENCAYMLACSLLNQQLYRNIYTNGLKYIKEKVIRLYKNFKNTVDKAI